MIYIAIGTTVRDLDDKPICVTSHSTHLDPKQGDGYKRYAGREAMAKRIALCLNACSKISDADLSRIFLKNLEE